MPAAVIFSIGGCSRLTARPYSRRLLLLWRVWFNADPANGVGDRVEVIRMVAGMVAAFALPRVLQLPRVATSSSDLAFWPHRRWLAIRAAHLIANPSRRVGKIGQSQCMSTADWNLNVMSIEPFCGSRVQQEPGEIVFFQNAPWSGQQALGR